jgi:hypothetical protein
MARIIKEQIQANKNRVWGQFKLNTGEIVKFQKIKNENFKVQGNPNNVLVVQHRVECIIDDWVREWFYKRGE